MLATRAEEWKQQWLHEGLQQGLKRGEAAMLLRLLERRFGTLPGWVRDMVADADTPALEEWGLRVLDAASLDEVFGR